MVNRYVEVFKSKNISDMTGVKHIFSLCGIRSKSEYDKEFKRWYVNVSAKRRKEAKVVLELIAKAKGYKITQKDNFSIIWDIEDVGANNSSYLLERWLNNFKTEKEE